MPKDISPTVDAKRIVRAAAIKELRYIDKAVIRTEEQQKEIFYTPRSFILTSLNKNIAFENTPSKFDTAVQLIALSVSNNEFDKDDDTTFVTKNVLFHKIDTFLIELVQEYLAALPIQLTDTDEDSVFKKRLRVDKMDCYQLDEDLENIALTFYMLLLEKIQKNYPSGKHSQLYPYYCYEFFAVHFIQNYINMQSSKKKSDLTDLQTIVLPKILKICDQQLKIRQSGFIAEAKNSIQNISLEQSQLISQDMLKASLYTKATAQQSSFLRHTIRKNLNNCSKISAIELYFKLIPLFGMHKKCFELFITLQRNGCLTASSSQEPEKAFNLIKMICSKIIDPIIEHYSRVPKIYIPTEEYLQDESTPQLIEQYGKGRFLRYDNYSVGCLALLRVIDKFVPSLSEPLGLYCLEKNLHQQKFLLQEADRQIQEALKQKALLEHRKKEQQKIQQHLAIIEQVRQRREEENLKQAAQGGGSRIIVENDDQNRIAEAPKGLLKIKLTIKSLFYDTCRAYFNRYDEKLSRRGILFWKIKQSPNRDKLIRAAKTWLEQSPSFAKYPVRAFSLMCEQIVAILEKESKRSLLKHDILSLRHSDTLGQLLKHDRLIETIPVEDMFDADSVKREILIHYHRIQQLDSSKRRDTMDTTLSYANS